MSFFCLTVGGLLFSGRVFARLPHWGNFFKTNGQAARRTFSIEVVEGREERGLEEALAQHQVSVERWTERLTLPVGGLNFFARALDPGVV